LTLDLKFRLRNKLKVNISRGASNKSFVLSNQHGMVAVFLLIAVGAGMTSIIVANLKKEKALDGSR